MKNSETEKELFDLIKETLDNYEEQYILGSWENFTKQRRKRRKIILWFTGTGIAASLLTGWLGFKIILSGSTGPGSLVEQQLITSKTILHEKIDTLKDQMPLSMIKDNQTRNAISGIRSSSTVAPGRIGSGERNETVSTPSDPLAGPADNNDLILTDRANPTAVNEKVGKAEQNNSPGNDTAAGSTALNKVKPEDNMADLQGTDSADYRSEKREPGLSSVIYEDVQVNPRSRKIRFGLSLSPGITSTTTSSAFNYSGGLNADYSLSENLRLLTGIQVERQTVSDQSTSVMSSMPPEQTRAQLVDFDIPLNLSWKFLRRKSTSYYLAGGISSVVYLSEKYTSTSYSQQMVEYIEMKEGVPSVIYQMENVKTTETNAEEPLSTFDFAGRVNIIFGIEQQLSPRLFLHFEPYLKIPLSEQAARNLNFTISGLSCRIMFR